MFNQSKSSNYFIWKDISSLSFNIGCSSPNRVVPAANIQKITVPGQSGFHIINDGSFSSFSIDVECRLFDGAKIEGIASWLNGYGKLILSAEPDKFYNAVVNSPIPIEYMLKNYRGFRISFECNPIKHSANSFEHVLNIQENDFSFYGKGTVPSKPIITVYGNGSINLFVNDTEIVLKDVDHHITINSEIMDTYKGNENQNMKMSGSFPLLSVDKNIIKYTGNAERIEIIPNWGWL